MSKINDEMKATADYAIKSAKEKFGLELEFSEQDVGKLENLLAQAYQSLSSRVKDEKTSSAIFQTAKVWGGYLGELIRYKWGGKWILKGSEQLISIKDYEFSPIEYVYQKITNHPEHSVRKFIIEVERKLTSRPGEHPQPEKTPAYIRQPTEQAPANKQRNSVTIDRKLVFAGIGGVLLIIIIGIVIIGVVGFMIINNGKDSEEFKSNLSTFLVEAENLNVLTEQGVSNSDFRNQLAEVKSFYSVLNNSWPSSLNTAKSSFDQAIKGWELTLEVWDYDSDGRYLNHTFLPKPLLRECSKYIDANPEHAFVYSVDDWVGLLMGTASQYFEYGKASINK